MPEESEPVAPSPYIVREFNDRGTHWLLEDPQFLKDLIALLDENLAGRLDVARAERINRTFIPPDLRKRESDIVYKIPYLAGGPELLIYVLLEQQTEPDRLLSYRFLHYCDALWDMEIRTWTDREGGEGPGKLCAVIPVLLYVGKDRWAGGLKLSDLMEVPAELERFVPAWDTLVLDLHRTPPEALTQPSSPLGWALRALQAEKEPLPVIENVIDEAMSSIEQLPEAQTGQWLRCAWFLLQLVHHRRTALESPVLARHIVDQARKSKFRIASEETTMQSYAEYLEEKGEARGEQKMIVLFGSERLGLPDAHTLAILESVDSTEVLERLGLRLFEVESWQELVRDLPPG